MFHTRRYLFRMILFLLAVGGVAFLLWPGLEKAFQHNVGLNSLIVSVFSIGVVLNIRQTMLLGREARWVETFKKGRPETSALQPRLLASLVTMIGERRDRFSMTPLSLRSVLDGVGARLDETREISTYFTGLMIFLGLLGTFWGLSMTVSSVGDVIANLGFGSSDAESAFTELKAGLAQPLSGMGTAFSCSLLGLSGSLVLGFLSLQMGQAQNAFYNALEEWLSAQVRIGSSTAPGGEEQTIPVYIQALLEQTADSIDHLARTLERGEEGKGAAAASMRQLDDRLSALADQMKTEQSLMLRLAENQIEMRPILARLAEGGASSGLDDVSRAHLRNLDVTLGRMVDDMALGRDDVLRQMRSEFKFLARTIAALAGTEPPAPGGPSSGREGF